MSKKITIEDMKRKIQENSDDEFKEYATEQIRHLHMVEELGITADRSIEFLQYLAIREMVNMLCSDDGTMTEQLSWIGTQLSTLADCVYTPKPYHGSPSLSINGGITTYEG